MDRPDVVIATSPQLLVGLSGWWISRLKRVPFVLEVRDLWPESLSGAGVGDQSSLLYRGIGKTAAFLYGAADCIVVVTPAFRDHLVRNWSVPEEKIEVVPNGVETALFAPQTQIPEMPGRLKAGGKFVVSYIGTLGLAHGLDTLILAAEKLQAHAPEVAFLLVGEGADRERILALAQSKKLANLFFVPQQPRELIPAYISASDVCLVMLRNSEVFETVIPTKMLEFMSCARPVILTAKGQAQQILHASRGGLSVDPGNADALSSAILTLRQQPTLCDEMGKSGRDYIGRELSRGRTAEEFLRILDGVLGNAQAAAAMAA